MTHLRGSLRPTLFGIAIVLMVGIAFTPTAAQEQELDRVLEIERYPNEPMQLIKLKIRAQSVKEHIKQQFKDERSKFAIDAVTFREKDDWVKHLSITLRNESDKPVYGLEGMLMFKPLGFPMMFGLQLTHSKQLGQQPLLPGAEIELTVEQKALDQALQNAKNHAANLTGAVLSFSLDTVIYSDELRWYRGSLLRPDAVVPGRWVPVK